jgi:hypothetical protein
LREINLETPCQRKDYAMQQAMTSVARAQTGTPEHKFNIRHKNAP